MAINGFSGVRQYLVATLGNALNISIKHGDKGANSGEIVYTNIQLLKGERNGYNVTTKNTIANVKIDFTLYIKDDANDNVTIDNIFDRLILFKDTRINVVDIDMNLEGGEPSKRGNILINFTATFAEVNIDINTDAGEIIEIGNISIQE